LTRRIDLPRSAVFSHLALTLLLLLLASGNLAAQSSGQVDQQKDLIGPYESSCGTELVKMRDEWGKLGQNGPAELMYYESVSQMDAAAVQQKIRDNAGQTPGVLPRKSGVPAYDAANKWEDCLLRTQLWNDTLKSAGQPANPPPADPGNVTAGPVTPAAPQPDPAASPEPAPAYTDSGENYTTMGPEELQQRMAQCVATQNQRLAATGPADGNLTEAIASDCVKLDSNNRLYGGFRNDCGFEVSLTYCAYRPAAGAWTESFNCERGLSGLEIIGAYERVSAHTFSAEMIYWGACRYPATMATASFIPGQGLQFRCAPWLAADADPAVVPPAASPDSDSCSLQQLELAKANEPQPQYYEPAPQPEQYVEDSYYYEDTGPSTAEVVTDAALQMLDIYMNLQNSQSSGGGGYDSYDASGGGDGCTASIEQCNCWRAYCPSGNNSCSKAAFDCINNLPY